MKKTLAENFRTTIRNGELVFTQSCSDITAVVNIIFDMVDDVTEEECEVLLQTIKILRKYDK